MANLTCKTHQQGFPILVRVAITARWSFIWIPTITQTDSRRPHFIKTGYIFHEAWMLESVVFLDRQ